MAAPDRHLPLRVRHRLGRDQAPLELAADDREREALLGLAEDCPDATVTYETVPSDAK
ncbi:hypothetical protein [Streptomyces sp. NPDC054849]